MSYYCVIPFWTLFWVRLFFKTFLTIGLYLVIQAIVLFKRSICRVFKDLSNALHLQSRYY